MNIGTCRLRFKARSTLELIFAFKAHRRARRRPSRHQHEKRLRADARRNREKLVGVAAVGVCRKRRRYVARRASRGGPASGSARSTGIFPRANIWSKWSIGMRSRRCARRPTNWRSTACARCRAGRMDAALRRLHRSQARHGQQPAHPAYHQFGALRRSVRHDPTGSAGASSMRPSPMVRSAATSRAPMCCRRCRASTARRTRRTGATDPAASSRCSWMACAGARPKPPQADSPSRYPVGVCPATDVEAASAQSLFSPDLSVINFTQFRPSEGGYHEAPFRCRCRVHVLDLGSVGRPFARRGERRRCRTRETAFGSAA